MARKSSKKYLKEANAQIILFVLIMIIMRMVVLNYLRLEFIMEILQQHYF